MKKKVLVFPCGSEIGLEIHRSLSSSTHFELIGGSSVDDHGRYVYTNHISGIPFISDSDFIDKLIRIIDEYKIDFIFPAHDSVVLKLAQERERLNCVIVTSPVETCEISRSKLKTYEFFQDMITTPRLYKSIAKVTRDTLPVFLKPDVGQGSKGTYLAKSIEDIEFYCKKDPTLMILEYLPGKEYTIDCFTSRHGKLLFCQGRERRRTSNGISVDSTPVSDARFLELAEKINNKLRFTGVWFFQVKENSTQQLTLLEIAPRIAGTMGLERARGVNLALLSLFDVDGLDVSIFKNDYFIEIDRALENKYNHNINYDHVYIDFDDLVIFDGKVNTDIIKFIFQCANKDIKTHLLTRHREVLEDTLEKYRLTHVFDEVIWIKNEDPKSSYITERNAIFIDDSFTERHEVASKLGIPVFDAHMIEALLD